MSWEGLPLDLKEYILVLSELDTPIVTAIFTDSRDAVDCGRDLEILRNRLGKKLNIDTDFENFEELRKYAKHVYKLVCEKERKKTMWNWLTRKKPEGPDAIAAAESLNDSLDALKSQRMQILFKLDQYQKKAKEHHARGEMELARASLKQQQPLKTRLTHLNGQILKLEQTVLALESTTASADVAAAMKGSSQVMGRLIESTDIGEIEEIHGDLEDHMREAGILAETLSRPFGDVDVDEEELEIDEQLKSWALEMPSVPERKDEESPGLRLRLQTDSGGSERRREELDPL